MANRLSAEDAAFFRLDDRGGTTHLGSLLILDCAQRRLGHDELLALVESRLASTPRYRQRVREVTLGLSRPVWVDDHDFDITYHVRRSALPSPGAAEQLFDLLGRLMSRPLDRRRPLWEMYLIEGLAGDRMAILTKTHRALVSGRDAVEINQALIDDEPSVVGEPRDIWLPTDDPGRRELFVSVLTDVVIRPGDLIQTVRAVSSPLTGVGSAIFRSVRRAGSLVRLSGRDRPDALLDTSSTDSRRFTVAALESRRCVDLARRHDCAAVDIVLAGVTGALRRWLLARELTVDPETSVRVLVPLSAYAGGAAPDEIVAGPGSWAAAGMTGFVTDLPVGETNAAVRLSQIAHFTARHSSSPSRVAVPGRTWLPDVGAGTFHAMSSRAAAAMSGRSFSVPISIARGPGTAGFVAGSRVTELYPVPPVAPDRALSVGLTSYDGWVFMAFNADRDIMWDLGAMPGFLAESFDELDS